MATNISIRVPWHDSNWNGSVCVNPKDNQACVILKNIAEKRNNPGEIQCEACAGGSSTQWQEGFRPPCLRENGFFLSAEDHTFVVAHPYAWKRDGQFAHVLPATLKAPGRSFLAIPYQWMMRPECVDDSPLNYYFTGYDPDIEPDVPCYKSIWISNGINQRKIFEYFWRDVASERSLAIAYVKAIPFTDSPGRVVIAISPIKNIGRPDEYPYSKKPDNEKHFSAMCWERAIGHKLLEEKPEGFVFPFEQISRYLEEHPDTNPDDFLLIIPTAYTGEFSYAAEHLSPEGLIITLNRAIELLGKYDILGFTPPKGATWKGLIKWCKAALEQAWKDRGQYPGLGAILYALGIKYGADVANAIRVSCPDGTDFWEDLIQSLQSKKSLRGVLPESLQPIMEVDEEDFPRITAPMLRGIAATLEKNRDFWQTLVAINLTFDQAILLSKALDGELPQNCSSALTDINIPGGAELAQAVKENPYILYEKTRRLPSEYAISLEQIDLAFFPLRSVAKDMPFRGIVEIEDADDERRLRALITSILEEAASHGHTMVRVDDILKKIALYRPEMPGVDVSIDVRKNTIQPMLDFFAPLFVEKTITVYDEDNQKKDAKVFQLARYNEMDAAIRDFVSKRLAEAPFKLKPVNWAEKVRAKFRKNFEERIKDFDDERKKIEEEKEAKSIAEKATALNKLYLSAISVLTGGAGTGKTETMAILCEDEGIRAGGILVLAPTGKARMVLVSKLDKIKVEAQTVAQFLLSREQYDPFTHATFINGQPLDKQYGTVIIDESSMLTEDMFAALCHALTNAKRVIFAGDPDQLPPIGAGKPFYELCQKLSSEAGQPHYAELRVSNRQTSGNGKTRNDIQFAKFFTSAGNDTDIETLCASIMLASEKPSDSKNGGNAKTMAGSKGDEPDSSIELMPCKSVDQLGEKLTDVLARTFALVNKDNNTADMLVNFDLSLGGKISGKWMNFDDPSGTENWQILTPFVRRDKEGSDAINRMVQDTYAKATDRGTGVEKSLAKFWDPKKQAERSVMVGKEGILRGEKVINRINNNRWHQFNTRRLHDNDSPLATANGEIGITSSKYSVWRGKDKKEIPHHPVIFSTQPDIVYKYKDGADEDNNPLELAYALTVHKAQGSGFGVTILVLLRDNAFISREMLYTALTRQKDKIFIISNRTLAEILAAARLERSEIAQRMCSIFGSPVFRGIKGQQGWYDERLIHRASDGQLLRSKSELVIYEMMLKNGMKPVYEKQLVWGEQDSILPDFTLEVNGEPVYWEHLGMLGDSSYRKHWEKKRKRYADHGISEENGNLILSQDDPYNGALDSQKIQNIIDELLSRQK